MLIFKRITNVFLLLVGYFFSVLTKQVVNWGMPLGVSVEPSNQCNLLCKECPVGKGVNSKAKANMQTFLYKKIVDELSPYLINIIMYFQGEPFINPQIYNMISYAYDKRIYSIISSNGHFFSKENVNKIFRSNLKRLIISIDGTTQKVYEKYRVGGSLATVLDGTKLIIAEKKIRKQKYPKIILQFLVTAHNEHQIEDAKKLAKQVGADKITFKTAQIYNFQNGSDLIPQKDKFSRYKKTPNGSYTIKSKLRNKCWRMWTHPVVTVSGDVLPCCFDKDSKYTMGNINTTSFRKIWKSKQYNSFRKQILKNRKSIEICQNCTEGLSV